jgi:hypothetical protein
MRRLRPCPSCARHSTVHESACPFCGSDVGGAVPEARVDGAVTPARLAATSAAVALGFAVSACYGGPVPMPATTAPGAPVVIADDAGHAGDPALR